MEVGTIKYACIEVIEKKRLVKSAVISEIEKDMIFGLFAGIKVAMHGDNAIPFAIIYTPDKKYKCVNLNHHNIVSMEKYDGLTRTFYYLRSSDEDQKAAFDIITTITGKMLETARMRKDNIFINVDSYTDLPEAFTDPNKTTTKKTYTGTGAGVGASKSYTQNAWQGTASRTPTILFWQRKSEKPNKTLLTSMRDMVKQIIDGTYEHPEIVPADVPTVTTNDTTTVVYGRGSYMGDYD